MRKITLILTSILIATAYTIIAQNIEKGEKAPEKVSVKNSKEKILYSIDFSKASKVNINAREWMKKEGFEFKSDADSQKNLALEFKNDAINLKAKSGIFGLMIKEADIKGAKKVRLTWGVNEFPEGASYKKGVNNEAVMLYIYFGDKKLSSGSMFIPDSPYFLGLFLGVDEDINKPCIGRHFKEGGRFICLATPKPGETITNEFNLVKGFKDSFGENKEVPAISAIAFEVETSKSGKADSFIKKVEFLN